MSCLQDLYHRIPPELLDLKAMQSFFAALRSCGAEVVIFDTPPLLGLSDASILASKVDGTLVVVDINHASKGSLKQMKALLEQAKIRVIGCVVNKQRRSRKDTPKSYGYRAGMRSKRDSRSKQSTSYSASPLVTNASGSHTTSKDGEQVHSGSHTTSKNGERMYLRMHFKRSFRGNRRRHRKQRVLSR